ncbi:MAG TPA: cobalt ECF transporter T component CbiQ [Phycisphaerae bacterium]|nr:cobalt ECF transporter T component CbiQ [Phycisphaerae bacterium]
MNTLIRTRIDPEIMHHHYIDRFAYQDSPIHRIDPRAKTLAVAAYSAVLISLPGTMIPSPWFSVFPFALLVWGGIPLRFVAKHTLIVSPFILCLVALAPVFDRQPVQVGESMIARGWLTAGSILVRFVFGMAALIALASTTRFPNLLKGLEKLGVPRLLVSQLRFLYRYLFLLLDEAMHLRQARASRDAGKGPLMGRWRASAGLVGVLFVRTLDQAERTHLAMIARGYDGTIRLTEPLAWRFFDTIFVLVTALYLLVLRAVHGWF